MIFLDLSQGHSRIFQSLQVCSLDVVARRKIRGQPSYVDAAHNASKPRFPPDALLTSHSLW